jgi:hypothetical protein
MLAIPHALRYRDCGVTNTRTARTFPQVRFCRRQEISRQHEPRRAEGARHQGQQGRGESASCEAFPAGESRVNLLHYITRQLLITVAVLTADTCLCKSLKTTNIMETFRWGAVPSNLDGTETSESWSGRPPPAPAGKLATNQQRCCDLAETSSRLRSGK